MFLACTMEIATMLDMLKRMASELTSILEQDKKDMFIACEKARLIASTLKQQPNNSTSQNPTRNVAKPSQLHKNPMFRTSFFKKEDLEVIDTHDGGKHGNSGFGGEDQRGLFIFSLFCHHVNVSWTLLLTTAGFGIF